MKLYRIVTRCGIHMDCIPNLDTWLLQALLQMDSWIVSSFSQRKGGADMHDAHFYFSTSDNVPAGSYIS